jgi:hypothetical protein
MQTDSNNPFSPPPIPQPGAQSPGFAGFAGMQSHRGGLILGLGVGALGSLLLSCLGSFTGMPCGLVGFISLGLAIAGWIMASNDLRAMREGRMDPAGLSHTKTGKVCSIITVVLVSISLLISLVMLIFFGALFAAMVGGAAAGAAGAP